MTRLGSVSKLRRMPPDGFYIGRGCRHLDLPRSPFANPFKVGLHGGRTEVVAKFRAWISSQPNLLKDLVKLRGKLLLCHCEPGFPCHGQVLLQLIAGGRL